MAYKKTFETGTGFSGEYWRITKAEVNKISNKVEIDVALYKNKTARDEGLKPFARKSFILPITAIDLSQDLFKESYKAIKNAKDTSQLLNPNGVAFFNDAIEM